ncbi:hypothetical protein BpHYR1_038437 [Brachionus plicatilis]|uniref:CCHC-type domain-containing protein n=1 Tax=Brachionus plicatilis TaxID=10195 RepID=A0A3M7S0H7_BRAPC|nr:hypothetical protein BpHYR1_038437 [Brachionus plicatilis]
MLKRGMGNNVAYEGERGCYDEFVAAFRYNCIIYGWDTKKQAEAIEFCLVGMAKKAYDQMQAADKEDIKKILDTKAIILDKGMPGLEPNGRSRMLMSRLVSTVPSHIKSFLELQSDKSWSDIVSVFDKSVDYKEMYTGYFQQIKQEPMEINKMEQRESRFWNSKSVKFNGSCNFCGKFGHKSMDCLTRINQSSRKESNENSFRRYSKSSEYPTSSKRTEFNQESYTIDAELDEYENLEETTNTIYAQNYTHNQASNLVRVGAALEVNNRNIPMNMLIDSGATASFINPDRLPKDKANQMDQFLNNNGQVDGWDLKKADLTIRSARKTEKIKCATGQVKIRIIVSNVEITLKKSDFLANGTDSDHKENCESDFKEVGVAICKLSLNPTKKNFLMQFTLL